MSVACKMKWPIRRAAFELIDKIVLEGNHDLLPHYEFIKSIAIKQTGAVVSAKQMKYLGSLHYHFGDADQQDWWRDSKQYYERNK